MADDQEGVEIIEGQEFRVDWVEVAFLLLFPICATVSWVGITLAVFHLYRGNTLGLISLLVCGLGPFVTMRLMQASIAPWNPASISSWLSLVALLMAGGFVFFQPGEYLFNGSDASVYVNVGKMIERTGGITFSEDLLDTIPQSLWSGMFSRDGHWPNLYNRFAGGVQIAEGRNLILPNFFHLLPVWIATFDLLIGPLGGFYVNAVFGLLSLVALWLLGRRLFSPLAGTLGAALLLVNFGQIWFTRFPTSEILTQFFLLAGLYFTVLSVDGCPPILGLFAGVAFGLAAFCRIDVLILVSPLILAFLGMVALERRFSRTWWWFFGGFVVFTLHAAGHASLVATPYTLRTLYGVGILQTKGILAATALLAGVSVLWAVCMSHQRYWAWLKSHAPMLAGGILGLLGLRLWPHITSDHLGLLLSPVGVAVTFAGLVLVFSRSTSRRELLSVMLFLGSALLYLESSYATPNLPWQLLRSTPIFLPVVLLFVLDQGGGRASPPSAERPAGAGRHAPPAGRCPKLPECGAASDHPRPERAQAGHFAGATRGFTVHRFPLSPRAFPGGGDEGTILTLRTTTFISGAKGLNDDFRKLGVGLNWVAEEEDKSAGGQNGLKGI